MFWQIIAHLVGDYMLQSDWMASEKTKPTRAGQRAAEAHVVMYTLPFLALTRSWEALLLIALTHYLIDRYRLARYICWAKNWLAPNWLASKAADYVATDAGAGFVPRMVRNRPWAACQKTGYPDEKPEWLAVWLLIITDNTLHVLCNALALRWF